MELRRAEIKNFRSIKDLSIDLSGGCKILLGINESGKSSILRALNLLDPERDVTAADLRIERQDESPIETGLVRFVFLLTDAERKEIYETVSKRFSPEDLSQAIVRAGPRSFTLRELVFNRDEGLYQISLPDGARSFTYWSFPAHYAIEGEWKKARSTNSGFIIRGPIGLANEKALKALEAAESLLFEPLTTTQLSSAIGSEIVKSIKEKLPQCIYWQFSEKYLLPSSIDIGTFCADPSTCLPLKSMFELAGIKSSDVGSTLSAAHAQPAHRYLHLLSKVSAAATQHLHKVWPEHRSVKIELRAHGSALVPVVRDEDIPLDMENRSDGFKRFVSFLLLVSARVKTEQIKNSLLLVDEPEIGLHPSGARSLMNELISIGSSNNVVFSTHSIFMVDKECIDRHLIVTKKDEITILNKATKSKIQDEEVLYSAIGYSVFETLKIKNVIFEGWRDKQLFQSLKNSLPKADKDLKESLKDIGLTFAEGVKDVRHVARFLGLAGRGCLIISDGDSAGKQWQREYRKEHGHGQWVTLDEIFSPRRVFTAEDLLTIDCIKRNARILRREYGQVLELDDARLAQNIPMEQILSAWLTETLEAAEVRQAMDAIKTLLFQSIKRTDLIPEASHLLNFVASHEFSFSSHE